MGKFRSPHDSADLDQGRRKKNALRLAIAFGVFAFVFQIVGAIYTGSLALLGDTAHLFTDLVSLVIALVAVTLIAIPATHARSYGLFRLEVLAAFLNGILLLAVAAGLCWEAVERLQSPQPVLALPLMGVAFFGMLMNLLSALVLSRAMKGAELPVDPHQHHGHSHEHHGHEHGHGHHHHVHSHHDHGDRNLHGALLHVLSDALSSLAVVVGALLTHFTNWNWVDPALAIILGLLILRWAVKLLKDSGHVLLEGTPRHLKSEAIEAALKETDSCVNAIEDLHVWEITSRMYVATAEIRVGSMSLENAETLRRRMSGMLQEKFGIAHSVLALKP